MPHNAFWGRSAGQVNVTRAGFAVSYFVSHTCWQPLPQRVISVNANDSTAAGIKRLRRLKFKRCGELASRLSSRLTFAWGCVAVRAIHLTVNMPLQISLAIPRLSGAAEMRGPARGTMPTSICGSVSTVRFARSGRISFRLMAQRLEVSVDNMARESWMYYRHSNSK